MSLFSVSASAADITEGESSGLSRRAFQIYATLVTASVILALALSITRGTDGQLFYTLDDPYIHLAVAESILAGDYGINVGEHASPTSSILYPFLLAGLLALGFGTLAPGLLASGAALWSAWLIAGVYAANVVRPEIPISRVGAVLLLPILLLGLNIYALPLTGMEHSLHVLTVCFVVVGLTRLDRDERVPALLVAGIVLGPLIRFEGLALSAAGLLALAWFGKVRALALCLAALAVTIGGYVAVKTALGLPPLPSSVLVKSTISASALDSDMGGTIAGMLDALRVTLTLKEGALLVLAMIAIWVSLAHRPDRGDGRVVLAWVALAGLAAHVVAGQWGWWARYEIYAMVLAALALLVIYRDLLRAPVAYESVRVVGLAALFAVAAQSYAPTTLLTPAAAVNIYAQQHQMHRFATEYFPEPVAVNDLGWVAFENDTYVLDLWGLGSEEARKRRQSPDFGTDDIEALVGGRSIAFAMVYDTWLGAVLPEDWCAVATLHTPRVSAAEGEVAFYLIDRAREAEFRAALEAFAPSLPPMSHLSVRECGHAS